MPLRRLLLAAVTSAALAAPAAAQAAEPGLLELVGALHEHSGYSDGWPGSTPRNYFAAAKREGIDFMGSGEHSDTADVPLVLSDLCEADPAKCLNADPVKPSDAFRKWPATLEQADAANTAEFTAFRGFEWSSDRFGHVNVYFSGEDVNAKADGGYADMKTFYGWLTRPADTPGAPGGSDGLATFNHPGAKQLNGEDRAAFNWNDFRYVPAVDAQMVGMETFNDQTDYGSVGAGAKGDPPPEGWYARALDKGWHIGAVGAEDLGHDTKDNWGGQNRAKTVVLAADRSREAIKEAMRARRFYAIRRNGIRLKYSVDGEGLGSRIARRPGDPLRIRAAITAPATEGDDLHLDVITSGGKVVATGDETLDITVPAAADQRYYYLRARRGAAVPGEPIAYSSPVWVTANGSRGSWLAGDLHVHSCLSGDVFCGPSDEPLAAEPGDDPEHLAAETRRYLEGPGSEAYTYGLSVGQRFAEASVRGLDFTAITDHNDVRSSQDPGFGAAGVVAVPGYESSLDGHAQMLGARKLYPATGSGAAAVNGQAAALRADGGAFQINHPDYRASMSFDSCAATTALHWRYGYDVVPDTIELVNPTSPAGPAQEYYECWLARGARIAATGGSDTHWASLSAAQGQGSPTTWVLARERTPSAILAALRAGRTTISKTSPSQNPSRLLLEADADRDGTYEASIGDTVVPGTPMRVRTEGGASSGYVTVRANGMALLSEKPLAPGQGVGFDAPLEAGWVRATLVAGTGAAGAAPGCQPNGQSLSTCAYDSLLLGLTSPIYLAERAAVPGVGAGGTSGAGAGAGSAATGSGSGSGGATGSGQGSGEATTSTGSGPGAGVAAPVTGAAARPALRVRFDLRRRPLRSTVLRRRGIKVRVTCSAACSARVELRPTRLTARRLGARAVRLLGRTTIKLPRGGARTRVIRLPASVVRRLRGGHAFELRLTGAGPARRQVVRLR